MKSIEIDRTKLLRDQPATGHNRLHPDIPPILEVDEGEEVVLETRDGCDGYLGPSATAATKLRALQVAEAFVDEGAFRDLVREHAATRQRDEAAEGVASFREKRAARWYPGRA